MADKDIILEVRDLKKYFKSPTGTLHAVDGVNFSIRRGETLGLVGESGCGNQRRDPVQRTGHLQDE